MKNCLVMGFGRSGTSLMGGILHKAGYYMGDNLYPPRHSNPSGFFENDFINGINERILEKYDYSALNQDYPRFEKPWSSFNPKYGQRWLSYITPEINIRADDKSEEEKIRKAVSAPCFAYKDPRFNYTLPVWKNYLDNDTQFICMFREPEITADSVMKDCQSADYLTEFHIGQDIIYRLWFNSYTRLLRNLYPDLIHMATFVHYRQLLSGQTIHNLADILEAPLNDSFVSEKLNRSRPIGNAPQDVSKIYHTLCELADYRD